MSLFFPLNRVHNGPKPPASSQNPVLFGLKNPPSPVPTVHFLGDKQELKTEALSPSCVSLGRMGAHQGFFSTEAERGKLGEIFWGQPLHDSSGWRPRLGSSPVSQLPHVRCNVRKSKPARGGEGGYRAGEAETAAGQKAASRQVSPGDTARHTQEMARDTV